MLQRQPITDSTSLPDVLVNLISEYLRQLTAAEQAQDLKKDLSRYVVARKNMPTSLFSFFTAGIPAPVPLQTRKAALVEKKLISLDKTPPITPGTLLAFLTQFDLDHNKLILENKSYLVLPRIQCYASILVATKLTGTCANRDTYFKKSDALVTSPYHGELYKIIEKHTADTKKLVDEEKKEQKLKPTG